jgi:hypothetical protein
MLFEQNISVICPVSEHAIPEASATCDRTRHPGIGHAPLFFVRSHHPESSISAVPEGYPAVNFLQKQQKQRRRFKQTANRAFRTAVELEPDYNLREISRCRFAAGAAIADNLLNHLLQRRQLVTPSGWPSIAAIAMLLRYRNWRKAAA